MSDSSNRSRLGFVGLGVMGSPMAGHLAEAGYALAVLDLDSRPAAELAARFENVRMASSLKDLAETADIVVTMLPSGREVRDVTLGVDGLIETLRPGAMLVDTSSSEPWITRELGARLEARGIAMVDAPVSGAEAGAKAAELVFMIGGRPEHVERAQAVLKVLGHKMFHLGALGSGHIMKAINNTITAVTLVATAEGLLAGKKLGLDPEAMNKVLIESTGMSWVAHNHIAQRIISRRFDDPFKLDLMVKDMGIADALAAQADLKLPVWSSAQAVWRAAQAAMPPGGSVSDVVRHMELLSGIELTQGASR